jgi:hypothetical protein
MRHRAQHCSQATGGGSTPTPGRQRRAAALLLLEGIKKRQISSFKARIETKSTRHVGRVQPNMKVMKSGGLPQKYTFAFLS